jgi:hypothetical protein
VQTLKDGQKYFRSHTFELEVVQSPAFPNGKCLDHGVLSLESDKNQPYLVVRNPSTGMTFFSAAITGESECKEGHEGKIEVSVMVPAHKSKETC